MTIDLNITSSGMATLNLYDITDRLVTVIEPEQFMTPGRYITRADLSDIPQGTYIIRFEQGSVIRTQKLVKL